MSGDFSEVTDFIAKWIVKIAIGIVIIIGLFIFLIVKACSYDRMIKVFGDTKIIETMDGHYVCYFDSNSIHAENYGEFKMELLKEKIERLKKQIEDIDREKLKKLMEGL